ncbi:MAG: tripartite tricarboxylate transporter substrate binding protein [Hyphomicrobiales bacterium]|nr:tripartite tricarboxylate transporter substrate binding protein [Hyphomicrobiales bacterium]
MSPWQPAAAQDYPTKPIRLVVGFAAGGGNDLLARVVAPKLSEQMGQPVIIENRTGAGGRLAIEYVQSQPPDGHAVAIGAIGQLAVATAIYPNLPFHPTRTLIPVSMLASYPLVVSGPASDAIRSLPDLVAFAKANPAKANYPSSSPIFTISSELLKMKTGMPGQMIPYRSTNEMLLSVVSGQTLFAVADSAATVSLAQSGKVRALAVAGPARISELPDVPTMLEAGLADIDIKPQWSGAFVAAGTPPAIVQRLETELRRTIADPAVRERIRAMSYYPEGGSGDDFRRRIDFDIQVFADVVKAAQLKFEQ